MPKLGPLQWVQVGCVTAFVVVVLIVGSVYDTIRRMERHYRELDRLTRRWW